MKEEKLKIRLTMAQSAAQSVMSILQQLGFMCAIHGELACHLYGVRQIPKSVEVLVLSPLGVLPPIITLKQAIALKSSDPSYFFTSYSDSTSHPGAMTLHYHDRTISGGENKFCAVNISYFHNPPVELIQNINGLAVLPLPFLLLQKLRYWEEVVRSSKKLRRIQQVVQDVQHILEILEKYATDLGDVHFDPELFESSKESVLRYCKAFPAYISTWKKIGFATTLAGVSPPVQTGTVSGASEAPMDILVYLDYQSLSRIQMIYLAGKMLVDILSKLGCKSAIFGSLACFMYGNTRPPNDLDILVLPPPGVTVSIESLKLAIVELDSLHFFLVPARDPQATYRLLYFRLNNGPSGQTVRTSCKVDIVAPGVMHLPSLPIEQINWDEGLPLIPFSLLLLQKLQSWDDHRTSMESLKRLKQKTDIDDLQGLLELSEIVPLRFLQPWSDRSIFHVQFEALTRSRVKLFCFLFPQYVDGWRRLGFET